MSPQPDKPLEQIVREVGTYSLDAFVFVQECIGVATDHVHGPLSGPAKEVAEWMAASCVSTDELQERWETESLPPDILKALGEVGGPQRMNRHVTGQQLCEVIRDVARERWGLMARSVLRRWGVQRTEDLGQIVFALVNNGWLQKQPTDSIRDFDHVYSFAEAFERAYKIAE